jgi:hypothetical protein
MNKILRKAQEYRNYSRELTKAINRLKKDNLSFESSGYNEDLPRQERLELELMASVKSNLRWRCIWTICNLHDRFTDYRINRDCLSRSSFLGYDFRLEKKLIMEFKKLYELA